MSDPDQPPDRPPERRPAPTDVALFSVRGIAVAAALGSVASGAVLVYLNYRALGYGRLARQAGLWGVVILLALMLTASLLPLNGATLILFTVLQGVIAYFLANTLQGEMIRYHRSHGGPMHSSFVIAAVVVLTQAVMVLLMFVLLLALGGGQPPSAAG